MAKRVGIVFLVLGTVFLLISLGFVIYNHIEDENAKEFSNSLLQDMEAIIEKKSPDTSDDEMNSDDLSDHTDNVNSEEASSEELNSESIYDNDYENPGNEPKEMETIEVNGYDCLGILSIPDLDLKLPVLSDWSYSKLKKAPCHYFGTYYESNFVIAAHNYDSHFGRLSELQENDIVLFTNVSGESYYYRVCLIETLEEESTKEMISSGFDLSLYTCTTGGGKRVTVRCRAVK